MNRVNPFIEDMRIYMFTRSGGEVLVLTSGQGDNAQPNEQDADEVRAFVAMCTARKLNPSGEILRAIQARYDAMLAE